jgi:HSP20 family molecular chaperone IbpA
VIEIAEQTSQYIIVVPLTGIDPRSVYVFATPRSLLVEVRVKRVVSHQIINGFVTESIKERISREFSLPVEIEQGATNVKVRGDSLQITAGKSQEEQQKPWSQLIHFDTRASLGCV